MLYFNLTEVAENATSESEAKLQYFANFNLHKLDSHPCFCNTGWHETKKEDKMDERFSRTEALIGSEALNKLKNAKVAIFGIGGVGGYVLEGLVRSGVGELLC